VCCLRRQRVCDGYLKSSKSLGRVARDRAGNLAVFDSFRESYLRNIGGGGI